MAGVSLPQSMVDLSEEELIRWVMEGFRRIAVHYGCWFREVEYQLGMERAVEVESEAGDLAWGIMLKRLSTLFGFEVQDGVPAFLKRMKKSELLGLIDAVCLNWLASDGVWFQAVEKRMGMDAAKRCNDTCWSRFSPYEALRVKELLGLPKAPGLDGLKAALGFRMYSRINKQSIHDVDENSFVFRMDECRVQSARRRKGLPDYPCKSAGMVEYPFFAAAVDPRIQTTCVGCPPDEPSGDWCCAWRFTLKE